MRESERIACDSISLRVSCGSGHMGHVVDNAPSPLNRGGSSDGWGCQL